MHTIATLAGMHRRQLLWKLQQRIQLQRQWHHQHPQHSPRQLRQYSLLTCINNRTTKLQQSATRGMRMNDFTACVSRGNATTTSRTHARHGMQLAMASATNSAMRNVVKRTATTNAANHSLRDSMQLHRHCKRSCKQHTRRTQRRHLSTTASSSASTKVAAGATPHVPEPTRDQLKLVALAQAIPFIGFGIMDNSILIIAGDAIDTSLGVMLGISTLCAAAIGNIISDVAGIMLGTVIEDFCTTVLKLPVPKLTDAQRQLRSVRWTGQLGCGVGIVIGCIIGMFPLMFLDPHKTERKKRDAHLEKLFRDVVTEAKTLVGAESTCLYLRVQPPPALQPRKTKAKAKPTAASSSSLFDVLYWWHTSIFGSASTTIDKRSLRPTATGTHLYAMYYVLPKIKPSVMHSSTASSSSSSPSSSAASTDNDMGFSSATGRVMDTLHSITSRIDGSDPSSNIRLLEGATMMVPGSSQSPNSALMIPLGRGIVSRAAMTGRPWNIYDVHAEPDFATDPSINDRHDSNNGDEDDDDTRSIMTVIPSHVKNMAVVPVLDGQGRTIAVIQAMNKISGGQAAAADEAAQGFRKASVDTLQHGFLDRDVQILMALASHISVSLQSIYTDEQDEEEVRLKDTIRILKEHGLSGIHNSRDGNNSNIWQTAGQPNLFPE